MLTFSGIIVASARAISTARMAFDSIGLKRKPVVPAAIAYADQDGYEIQQCVVDASYKHDLRLVNHNEGDKGKTESQK